MRFGIYVNGYGTGSPEASLQEAEEQTRLAESVGFDWAVLGERHLHRPGHHEILTTATWLAAKTDRIGIATAGIVLPFYQPYFLAQALANLDAASLGRLTAGFVLGYRQDEFSAMGASFADRAARFETNLEILQRLWDGETVSVEDWSPVAAGNAVTETEERSEAFVSPLPARRPRPPIWNGGRVRAALRRTAWSCDGWTTSFNEDKASLTTRIAQYRALPQGPRSLGKSVIVCRDGFCAPTSQAARNTLEGPLLSLCAEYAQWKKGSVDQDRYTDLTWESIAPRVVAGSPAQLRAELAAYAELGADAVILRVQPPELSHRDAMRCLELIGSEVIPALSGVAARTGDEDPTADLSVPESTGALA